MADYHAEIRRMFIAALGAPTGAERDGAAAGLASSIDPNIRILAEAAAAISKAREGGTQELGRAAKALGPLPDTSYWSGLIEEAGKAVLGMGLSLQGRERNAVLEQGLSLAGRAMAPGFPLSPGTIDLVKAAKKAAPEHSVLADEIVRMNHSLLPEGAPAGAFRERPPEKKRAGRRRVR